MSRNSDHSDRQVRIMMSWLGDELIRMGSLDLIYTLSKLDWDLLGRILDSASFSLARPQPVKHIQFRLFELSAERVCS